MLTVLSNRQYVMLVLIVEKGRLTIKDAGELNQTTFRSMLSREYIVWDGKWFSCSRTGASALGSFEECEIRRKVASLKLTGWLRW
jgi:hypothetical protein